MKKLLVILLVGMCLLGVAGVTYGKSGSAVIPSFWNQYFSASNKKWTVILVSNITDEPIAVKLTFFSKDGSILTTGITSENVSNFTTSVTNASCSFDLTGKTTGNIVIDTSSLNYGFGLIEWSQDSNTVYGLVAHGAQTHMISTSTGYNRYAIPINNGLPF